MEAKSDKLIFLFELIAVSSIVLDYNFMDLSMDPHPDYCFE
jgi:hypothetical protein